MGLGELRGDAQGFLAVGHRRFKIALEQQGVAEVIVAPGAIRLALDRLPVLLDGLVEPAHGGQRHREVKMRHRETGRGSDRRLELFDRLVILAALKKGVAQGVVGQHVL